METKHTPGPWFIADDSREVWSVMARGSNVSGVVAHVNTNWPGQAQKEEQRANGRLIAAAPDLLVALREARRAIGDHIAPDHCYATGPLTGNEYRDLVECPACSAIAMYNAAIDKATGAA
jgi:hypothetical protein